jgi:hypothetical protein
MHVFAPVVQETDFANVVSTREFEYKIDVWEIRKRSVMVELFA